MQLTDLPEPVDGRFVPGSDRILLTVDEGGNERAQLYLLDPSPGSMPEPLVVEPDFLQSRRPCRGRRLLAYTCNRGNGRDLDVYVRSLETGEEEMRARARRLLRRRGLLPDGRWLGVLKLTDRTGDNDLHLVDLVAGRHVLVAPEEEDAVFGPPAWTRRPRRPSTSRRAADATPR